jgi:hypothetical protein
MSKIALSGNASGTGTFTFAAPGTNTDRTLTLPDASGTLARTADIPSVNPFTLGTAVASTSGTAIDFTGIPSWAKRVTVMFDGVSTNGTSAIIVRLGAGSVQATGYTGSIGGTAYTTGSPIVVPGLSSENFRGSTVILNVTSNSWVATGLASTNAPSLTTAASSVTLSGTLDRVRITTVNGTDTFDLGTINISYEG